MELYVATVRKSKSFGDESCPKSGLTKLVKLVISEPGEDGALAYPAGSHCDKLDLGNPIVNLIHLSNSYSTYAASYINPPLATQINADYY